ncbi:hypothetical protein B296_00017687 [Ensete ventricosum]|uniref:Uncharacterized protein n=1 Tax=Ensete ventricosum TaxID=4639 RepID=A0A427ASJ1_ENSVE|nr:hypothetical protein B296_00017687 [Ensete ventricosum]
MDVVLYVHRMHKGNATKASAWEKKRSLLNPWRLGYSEHFSWNSLDWCVLYYRNVDAQFGFFNGNAKHYDVL